MPALLWVLFWSSMMASASCYGESIGDAATKSQAAD